MCFAKKFSLPHFVLKTRPTPYMNRYGWNKPDMLYRYYMHTASLESEMGSSQHKWPHQARAFMRGLNVVTSSRHTKDAVRIFTYEYLSEKTHEMGWSQHTSRSESQQHECENIINRMHLFIVSRVVPTKIGN